MRTGFVFFGSRNNLTFYKKTIGTPQSSAKIEKHFFLSFFAPTTQKNGGLNLFFYKYFGASK